MNISIFDKSGNLVASVVVGSNSYTINEIMGDAYLQLEFAMGEYVDIRRDSYCVYNGVRYTLITSVNVEKISTVEYNYSARFEAPQELLENIIMSHMAGENQLTTKAYERNFPLAGTAQEHIEMLLRNTDERLHTNFHIGTIDPSLTGVKTVAYNVVSCKSALQLIANAFECEWWVSGNESEGYAINLGKCSFNESTPTKLAYGHDNGVLGGTKRQLHKDAQRMTHIAVQGGSQNINTLSQLPDVPPYKYSTLHLPKTLDYNDTTGVGHIFYDVRSNKFEGETGFSMATSVLLTIDRNANTMTSSLFNEAEDVIVERAFDLSEFYPKKSRFVSAFSFQRNNTEFYIEDSSIEDACDYKHYQLGGEKITIVFQTGALAGKTFDVINYDHENRRFECALADYDTISMPSLSEEMWRPVVGEEFIVYGTALPKSYFADMSTDPYSGAEWEMARRTASILCENFNDKYAYSLTIDSNWLSRRTAEQRNALKCGFWVHFVDNQLAGGGVDIRITAVKEFLTRPLQPELTIGDEVKTVSIAQKLQQIQSSVSATYNYVQSVQEQTQRDMEHISSGSGGGNVDDVQVNGVSVLKDRVAKIDLSNYVDMSSNQRVNGRKIFEDGKLVVRDGYRPTVRFNKDFREEVHLGIDFTEPNRWYPYFYSDSEEKSYDIALIGHGEYGDQTHPIYIDERGRTKKCSISLSDLATYEWVNQQGFLKSIPSSYVRDEDMNYYLLNYAKMEWVDSKGYAKQSWIESNFAKKTDLPTIDTSAPSTPSDDHVPSTKLFADNMKIIGELFNGLADRKADKSDLNNYYNKTEIDERYYNKAYLNVVLSALATKSETQKKSDYVRFEQSGQYASYTFSETSSRGATLSSRTTSTGGTSNLQIAVHITGLTTTAEYNVYLLTHRVNLLFCGKNTSGNVIQMEALRNVTVNQIGTDVYLILQLDSNKVFDPSSYPNTFNVVFEPID